MKKIVSILMTMAFIIGITGTAFAAPKTTVKAPAKKAPVKVAPAKVTTAKAAPVVKTIDAVGQVKNFNDSSVTICVDGKNTVFTYDASTKVTLGGEDGGAFLDVANKAVSAKFTATGTKLTSIDFGQIGDQGEGALAATSTYVRFLKTDSNLPAAGNTAVTTNVKKEIGKETDTDYTYGEDGDNVIALGSVDIILGTVKVSLNDKDLKVIDEKAQFDKTVVGDEVQLYIDPDDQNMYKLRFEKPIFDNANTTQEDAQKVLKVSYDKKMYSLTSTDVNTFTFDENVYSELNGKEVTLPQALNRGNYAYYVLSTNGSILYVNAFYKNLACKVESVDGNKITFSVNVKGKTPFKDTLEVTDDANIHDATGAPITLGSLKAGDAITVTTDPDNGYSVIEISKAAAK